MNKHSLISALAGMTFCLLVLSMAAQAQPGGGGPIPTPTDVPIDGGASLLLAAGGAYAVKRLRQRRQNRAERAA